MSAEARRKIVRFILASVLAVELVGAVVVLIRMLPTFPEAGPDQSAIMPLWVSLVISLAVSCVWLGATLRGSVRAQGGWVRGSGVTIHVLMLAAATGVLQGILGSPALGGWMLALGIVGLLSAAFWRPKTATGTTGEPSVTAGPEAAGADGAGVAGR